MFTEEITRLRAALKAERAAVVEARKDKGNDGKRELDGYLMWVLVNSFLIAFFPLGVLPWRVGRCAGDRPYLGVARVCAAGGGG